MMDGIGEQQWGLVEVFLFRYGHRPLLSQQRYVVRYSLSRSRRRAERRIFPQDVNLIMSLDPSCLRLSSRFDPMLYCLCIAA